MSAGEGEDNFQARGFERLPSPESWEEEVFYSILVDRFANGDITNDNSRLRRKEYKRVKKDSEERLKES